MEALKAENALLREKLADVPTKQSAATITRVRIIIGSPAGATNIACITGASPHRRCPVLDTNQNRPLRISN